MSFPKSCSRACIAVGCRFHDDTRNLHHAIAWDKSAVKVISRRDKTHHSDVMALNMCLLLCGVCLTKERFSVRQHSWRSSPKPAELYLILRIPTTLHESDL